MNKFSSSKLIGSDEYKWHYGASFDPFDIFLDAIFECNGVTELDDFQSVILDAILESRYYDIDSNIPNRRV